MISTEGGTLELENPPEERGYGVVLDCDSQSTEAIARMYRDAGVDIDVVSADTRVEELQKYDFLVGSGGSSSVHNADAPDVDLRIFDREHFDKPIHGICYFSQLMVDERGGVVVAASEGVGGTYGLKSITVVDEREPTGMSSLDEQEMLHSNGDHFTDDGLPFGFVPTSFTSGTDRVSSFVDEITGNIGTQFHPELSDVAGYGLVRNWLDANEIKRMPRQEDISVSMRA